VSFLLLRVTRVGVGGRRSFDPIDKLRPVESVCGDHLGNIQWPIQIVPTTPSRTQREEFFIGDTVGFTDKQPERARLDHRLAKCEDNLNCRQ
jgi:hypothetical protein